MWHIHLRCLLCCYWCNTFTYTSLQDLVLMKTPIHSPLPEFEVYRVQRTLILLLSFHYTLSLLKLPPTHEVTTKLYQLWDKNTMTQFTHIINSHLSDFSFNIPWSIKHPIVHKHLCFNSVCTSRAHKCSEAVPRSIQLLRTGMSWTGILTSQSLTI